MQERLGQEEIGVHLVAWEELDHLDPLDILAERDIRVMLVKTEHLVPLGTPEHWVMGVLLD